MPTMLPEHCALAAILPREDPRDAFVPAASSPYQTLSSLPAGSKVGTSSIRRMAQLSRTYPHLTLADMRGNVPGRLAKLDNPDLGYAGIILATAGLNRIDLQHRIGEHLQGPEFLHAVGQGAIGVECREGDAAVEAIVRGLNDEQTAKACLAERALLRTLEGGCSVPIGVETRWEEDGRLSMKGRFCSVNGAEMVECEEFAEIADEKEAEQFGRAVAGKLVELGCLPILAAIPKKVAKGEGQEASTAVSEEKKEYIEGELEQLEPTAA